MDSAMTPASLSSADGNAGPLWMVAVTVPRSKTPGCCCKCAISTRQRPSTRANCLHSDGIWAPTPGDEKMGSTYCQEP